jgi:periplasmic protein CpxP/Spy
VEKRTWLLATAGGVVLLASAVAFSVAQTPAAPPPGRGMMAGSPQMVCDNLDAFLAAGLAFARTKLALADSQVPAWNKFSATARDAIEPVRQACATLPRPEIQPAALPPLPERLDRAERFGDAGLEALRRLRPAVTELYAALTPEQKEIADRLAPPHRR